MAEGSYVIKNGALYLDGTGSWLDVKKADGSSLLTGRDELTISFAAHPETGGSNWIFFAAPNTDVQELNQENYLGIIEFEESITAQRFMNTDGRPDSAQIDDIKISDWIYVTVAYAKDKTILYLNGKQVAEQASDISLSGTPGDANNPGILGNSSVLQIGKGNWGTGEYYKGYLDNFKIMGKVLTAEEIKAEADAYLGSAINVAKIENVVSGIDAIGEKIEATVDTRKALEEIRANYESLTEEEKKLVPNIETLIGAEKVYQEKLEDAETVLAEFTFDDAETGLNGSGALAAENGTLEFVEDAERGKVLSLSKDAWLNVTKEDGSPLLTGAEELTVSYYSKAGRTDTNWAFYAAPSAEPQNFGGEYYLGILENNKNITSERYFNGRQESPSAVCGEGWNHVVVVYGADDTKLYVNGELKATTANNGSLTGILGTESVLQVGKANWGEGEYYLGLLDDMKIYNYALSERDIKMLRGEIADTRELKDKIQEAKLKNQRSYTEESYAALQTAQSARDTQRTQAELDQAAASLQEAIGALEELDYTKLEAKLQEAGAIEQGNYTDGTYEALQIAIQTAQGIKATVKSQLDLDQAVTRLQAAVDALKENTQKPGEPEKPDDPNKPGEPEKPDDPNKPENPGDGKDILVKELKINPTEKNVTVGESFDVTVLVSPDNAKNKEVELTSSNPAVAKVAGKKVTALSAGQAVITVKAQDGSNTEAELKVTVRLKPVSTVKAVQQSAKKYVKVSFGKVSGASSYDIYRSVKASSGYKRIGSSTKNSYVDKKAGAGKTYYYKVVAKAKTAGSSILSTKYAKVKVLAVPKVKVKASKGRKLTVTWKKIKGASGYAVYTSTKKTKGFKKVKTIKKAKTVKAVIKAKKNVKKLYVKVWPYCKVSGKNVFGTYSKTITVKVKK